MKKTIFKVIGLSVILFLVAIFSVQAVAIDASTTRDLFKPVASAQEKIDQRCAFLTDKIATKIRAYDASKARHASAYNNLKDRLIKIVNQLDARGLDTGDLKVDLITLDQKITKFAEDYRSYINNLAETKSYACGHSQGEFASQLKDTRASMLIIKQDIVAIKSFYSTTIKPDLIALKAQIRNLKPATTTPAAATSTANN